MYVGETRVSLAAGSDAEVLLLNFYILDMA
jgi:hypothetical protein